MKESSCTIPTPVKVNCVYIELHIMSHQCIISSLKSYISRIVRHAAKKKSVM